MKKRRRRFACLSAFIAMFTFSCCGIPQQENFDTWENIPKKVEEQAKTAKEVPRTTDADRYVYGTLTEEERLVYDEIYQTIRAFEEKITVSTKDVNILEKAYDSVAADYGDIFWVDGYSYTEYTLYGVSIGLEFVPKYTMTQEERDMKKEQIDAAVAEILAAAPGDGASDYDKARYVFDYLVTNVAYDADAENNQNIISVFLNQKTVCQGYARATQYLLECLGIQSAVIGGRANGGPHAWNLVRLDDDYYYLDTTWGNTDASGTMAEITPYINYDYFCVTTAEIELTHRVEDDILLPECTATADNYYQREGFYFTENDPQTVGNIISERYNNGEKIISVKFASSELYQQMYEYFMNQQHIFDYCGGAANLYYVENMELGILTFCFS